MKIIFCESKVIKKVIFLDRDGTVNKEVNYLYKISDFEFIPGTIEAIKTFHDLGYLVIILTNQAGVARGYFSEKDIKSLHDFIDKKLSEGNTYIDAYYYCPHHPDGALAKYKKVCNCRKPNTGMLEIAVSDLEKKGYTINLSESIIIGDKEIDVKTGINFGIGRCILVKSGHKLKENEFENFEIYNNLLDFANNL